MNRTRSCLAIWRTTILIGGLLAVASGPASDDACAQGEGSPKVEVVGLTICRKDPNDQFGQSLVQGVQAGTQLFLRIGGKNVHILKVSGDAKTAVTIKESTGKTLKSDENFNVEFFSRIEKDGHSVIVPLAATDVPGPDATHLLVQGDVVLSCGVDAKTDTNEVELKADSKVKLGSITAKVTSIEPGFEPDTSNLGLESEKAFDQIQSLALIDANGKEIPCEVAGTSSIGFGDSTTHSRDYRFNAKADDIAKIKVTYFQKIATETVSVDLKVGLGLAGSK